MTAVADFLTDIVMTNL